MRFRVLLSLCLAALLWTFSTPLFAQESLPDTLQSRLKNQSEQLVKNFYASLGNVAKEWDIQNLDKLNQQIYNFSYNGRKSKIYNDLDKPYAPNRQEYFTLEQYAKRLRNYFPTYAPEEVSLLKWEHEILNSSEIQFWKEREFYYQTLTVERRLTGYFEGRPSQARESARRIYVHIRLAQNEQGYFMPYIYTVSNGTLQDAPLDEEIKPVILMSRELDDILNTGDEVTLRWTGGSSDERFTVFLEKNNEDRIIIQQDIQNEGRFTWRVSEDLFGQAYQLGLTSDKMSQPLKTSFFEVRSQIKYDLSAMASAMVVGTPYKIEWEGGHPQEIIDINLVKKMDGEKDWQQVLTLSDKQYNTGEYNLLLADVAFSLNADYAVEIVRKNYEDMIVRTPEFRMHVPIRSVTLSKDKKLKRGKTYELEWDGGQTLGQGFSVELVDKEGEVAHVIAKGVKHRKQEFELKKPVSKGKGYRIRITSIDNPYNQVVTQPFRLKGRNPLFGIVFLGALGYGGYYAWTEGYVYEYLGIGPDPYGVGDDDDDDPAGKDLPGPPDLPGN